MKIYFTLYLIPVVIFALLVFWLALRKDAHRLIFVLLLSVAVLAVLQPGRSPLIAVGLVLVTHQLVELQRREKLRGARVVLIAMSSRWSRSASASTASAAPSPSGASDDWVVTPPHHAARHQLLRVPHAPVRVRLHARRDQGEQPAAAGRVHDVHPDVPGRPAGDVPGLLREAHPRVRPPGVLLRPAAHRARLLQEGLRRRLPLLDLLRQDHHDHRQDRLRPRRREHVVAARLRASSSSCAPTSTSPPTPTWRSASRASSGSGSWRTSTSRSGRRT